VSSLTLRGIGKRFGKIRAIDGVDLDIADGEFVTLLGPTNAGKTTLLKIVAGLHADHTGRVLIGDRDVTAVDPARRRVSMVFQNLVLFPDRDGFENLAFPLRQARVDPNTVERRVREVAEMLRVGHVLNRLPGTYSGGEAQRIAIGRAITHTADILLLDEPLTNLDARIRLDLRTEFRRLHRMLGQTILYVTHDQVEALSLSDRIALIDGGRLHQIAPPRALYERPVSLFAASFLGTPPMNFLAARLTHGNNEVIVKGSDFAISVAEDSAFAGEDCDLTVGVRPEDFLVASSRSKMTPFGATLARRQYLGDHIILELIFGGGSINAVVPPSFRGPDSSDARLWIGFRPHKIRLFRQEGSIALHQRS
jgi:multiple sugar transport system ATP-binding protein